MEGSGRADVPPWTTGSPPLAGTGAGQSD